MRSWPRGAATTFAAASAAALTLVLTRGGILLAADSPAYLWTSRFVRSNPGSFLDLPSDSALSIRARFPPLYPMLLSVAGTVGDDLLAARFIGAVVAAASAGMLFRLVARHASIATAAVVVTLVFASRGYTLVLFGFLMSDGLYVMLALAALSTIEPIWASPTPRGSDALLLGAAAIASAALLTRIAGVGLIAAVAVLTLRSRDRANGRLALATIVIGLVPFSAWMLAQQGAELADRRIRWNSLDGLSTTVEVPVWSYLPRPAIEWLGSTGMLLAGAAAIAAIACWSVVQVRAGVPPSAPPEQRMTAAFLVVGWFHLASVVAARLLFDPLVAVNSRQTMLWLTCMVAAGGIDVHRRLIEHRPSRRGRIALASALMLPLLGAATLLVRAVHDPGASWWNTASEPDSRLAERVAREPRSLVAYSNREDILYLQTGRTTKELPLPFDAWGPDPQFERRTAEMARRVRARRAIVVVYSGGRDASVDPRTIERMTGAEIVFRNDEGAILAVGPAPAPAAG